MTEKKHSFIVFKPSTVVCRLVILVLVGICYVSPAYAYLDPGTGSIILQGLLAAIAGATAALGVYWQRIKCLFSSLFSSKKSKEQQPEQDSET